MSWGRNSNYNDNPCWECPKKGCGAYHSVCENYKMWSAKQAKRRAERYKQRAINNTIEDLAKNRMHTRLRKA